MSGVEDFVVKSWNGSAGVPEWIRETRTQLVPERLALRVLVVAGALALALGLVHNAVAEQYMVFANPYSGYRVAYPAGWCARRHGDGWSTIVSRELSDHLLMRLPHRTDGHPSGSQIRLDIADLPEAQGVDLSSTARRLGFAAVDSVSRRRRRVAGSSGVAIQGPRHDGWGAALVWTEEARLMTLSLYAPSRSDFEELRPVWDRVQAGIEKPQSHGPAQ